MEFHEKNFWFIWFHEFFCLDFFEFSGLLWEPSLERGYTSPTLLKIKGAIFKKWIFKFLFYCGPYSFEILTRALCKNVKSGDEKNYSLYNSFNFALFSSIFTQCTLSLHFYENCIFTHTPFLYIYKKEMQMTLHTVISFHKAKKFKKRRNR